MANKKKQQPKLAAKKKGGFFGKLLSFLMGMIMGIVGVFGGLAAIVFLILNKPVQETFDTVEQAGVDIPGELIDYVNGDFATLTLLEAFTVIGQTVGGIANGANTLQDLANISPILDKNFGNWATAISGFGVEMTKEDFLSLNFTNVGTYLESRIDEISIASLLGDVSASNSLMCSLLYGKKNVHYTVNEDNIAVPLPLTYTYNEESNTFTDWDGNVFENAGDVWVYVAANGTQTVIGAYQADPEQSEPASEEESETEITYAYEVGTLDSENLVTILYQLAQNETDSTKYNAYKNDVLQMHKGLTIGSLMQGDFFNSTINDMELFSLLNMNATTDKLLLALAGYEIKDGEAVLQEGKTATTLGGLKTNASSLINDMKIADIMEISDDNKLMMSLAYVDGNKENPRSLKDLTDNSSDIINSMKIAELIDIDPDNNLMMSVAYVDGDINQPRTLKDLSDDKNLVNNMKVHVALNLDMENADGISPIMRAIAFGKQYKDEGEISEYDYKIEDNKIVMLEGKEAKSIDELNNTDFIDTLELGEIITIDENSSQILRTLKSTPVGELSTAIDGLTLDQVITIDTNSPQILQYLSNAKIGGDGDDTITKKIDDLQLVHALGEEECNKSPLLTSMKDWKINEFGDKVDGLKLGDVIDTTKPGTPQILIALKDATLGGDDENTISNKVNTITIEQILGEDKVKGNFILKHLKDSNLTNLSSNIEELTFEQVFAGDIYDENGDMKGTWKYLLNDGTTGGHKIQEASALITNMTTNIQTAKLKDLKSDGILPSLDDNLLTKSIPSSFQSFYPDASTYGDLTITQLFDLVGKLTSLAS